ncbi:hypothetical protein AB833_05190 [Chromatiales bacterium (ex Bugula neritina AB1)]|nr:hypothetical protein AB833_05190 [Chromatiales bacterium (ex Bugula neritina AB1)]
MCCRDNRFDLLQAANFPFVVHCRTTACDSYARSDIDNDLACIVGSLFYYAGDPAFPDVWKDTVSAAVPGRNFMQHQGKNTLTQS